MPRKSVPKATNEQIPPPSSSSMMSLNIVGSVKHVLGEGGDVQFHYTGTLVSAPFASHLFGTETRDHNPGL
jgi:hypothetical protein